MPFCVPYCSLSPHTRTAPQHPASAFGTTGWLEVRVCPSLHRIGSSDVPFLGTSISRQIGHSCSSSSLARVPATVPAASSASAPAPAPFVTACAFFASAKHCTSPYAHKLPADTCACSSRPDGTSHIGTCRCRQTRAPQPSLAQTNR
jgi:hypothetical protein